jgi:copper homeostasis protein
VPLLEVCAGSVDALLAAEAAGAGRIELAQRLDLDGLTRGEVLGRAAIAAARVPVHVMIRPRAGDFVCRAGEFRRMQAEIAMAKRCGAPAVVLGLLDARGQVDRERTERLLAAARPMAVTFHRAFDRAQGLEQALDALVELGVERVLSSGGAASAEAGIPALRALVARAAGRIAVMAGGGVREHNAARILAETGVRELHSRRAFALPA